MTSAAFDFRGHGNSTAILDLPKFLGFNNAILKKKPNQQNPVIDWSDYNQNAYADIFPNDIAAARDALAASA